MRGLLLIPLIEQIPLPHYQLFFHYLKNFHAFTHSDNIFGARHVMITLFKFNLTIRTASEFFAPALDSESVFISIEAGKAKSIT